GRWIVEAHEGGGRSDYCKKSHAEHQRRYRQQQRRMSEDRQRGADRVDAEDDGGREAPTIEREHGPPYPWRRERADADQAPEDTLRCGSTAAVADIGDHEGHIGDVAGAKQEIAHEIDQHRPDGECATCRTVNGGTSI